MNVHFGGRESIGVMKHDSEAEASSWNKVDVPNSVTYLYWTPIFEWYGVWCCSKNKYQKDMCSIETGLCVLNMIIMLASIINIIGGDLLCNEHKNLTSIMNKICI